MSKGVQYMLIASFGFSLMLLSVKFIPHIPANEIVFFRSIISFVITVAMLRSRKIPLLGNKRGILLLRGVFGVIALTLFFITIQKVQLASAITVQYLSPIFTVILAIFILKEKVRPVEWFFFVLAFGGVVLVKGFDANLPWLYVGLGVTSAIFSGLAYNCVRLVKDSDHPLVVVLYFPLIAIPVMGVYTLFEWETPQGLDWIFLISTGLFTQVGQVYMTKAFHAENIALVSIVRYLGIIYALFWGYIFFDEVYSTMSLIGMSMVIFGVAANLIFRTIRSKSKA